MFLVTVVDGVSLVGFTEILKVLVPLNFVVVYKLALIEVDSFIKESE